MTAPLREVVTRFRFDMSESDLRAFNHTVEKMKGGLRTVAGLFGVSLGVAGVAAIAKMGLTAERAELQLRRLSGADFTKFRAVFSAVGKELDGIVKGAAGILKPKEFDEAAANFVKVFGSGKEQVDAFGRIFAFAARQSALTGKSVSEITRGIQDAIATGGFDALLDIPGFTEYKKEFLDFQQKAMNPGEPGGEVGRLNRMRAILDIIGKSRKEQEATLRNNRDLVDDLLAADKVGARMEETLERLGTTIDKSLVPALNKIADILESISGWFGNIQQKAKEAGVSPMAYALTSRESVVGAGKGILSGLGSMVEDAVKPTAPRSFFETGQGLGWFPQLPPPAPGAPAWNQAPWNDPNFRRSQGVNIEQIDINVQSSDPIGAANEILRKLDSTVDKARASSIPTERR
jgi:hypothetical protein